jgi:hypothetical protein
MFPVVFLSLAFGVLVTAAVSLAMFIDVAFFSETANGRHRATNQARDWSTKKEQTAVNGPVRPVNRAALRGNPKPFRPKQLSHWFSVRPHT